MSDVPPPSPLAAEIHARFSKKFAPGGLYDRILNGGDKIVPRPPASESEIARLKRNVEILLKEREDAIRDAVLWYRDWLSRQVRGFRRVSPRGENGKNQISD